MIQIIKTNELLIFIIIIAAILRLWRLDMVPPHLTSDEAALGYNAYSILMTGRDEHGAFLPVIFESFGDWKPGLYVYLTVPFIAILGLTEYAVRLPGAISGILAVFLLFLILQKMFEKKSLALFSALFLAISPWHLQFSRGAWESGLALTLVLAGIYFFLQSLSRNKNYLLLSVVFFSLTLWAYQGAKMSSTVVIGLLCLIYFRELKKFPKDLLSKGVILGLIISAPVLLSFWQGKTGRLEVYSIFSYPRTQEYVQEIIRQENPGDKIQYQLFHPEALHFIRSISGRWLNHYSPKFLLFEGDWGSKRHSVPDSGVLLFIDGLILFVGLGVLAARKTTKEALFIWLWLLLAPLPAALSRDSVHAVRAFYMVIPLTIILAYGASWLWKKFNHTRFGKIFAIGVFLIYLANFGYYLDQYWVHAPYKNSQYWQYGYKQIVQTVTQLQEKYPEIVVKQDYSQPYIFFLFYQKYDPKKYQQFVNSVYIPSDYGDVGLVSRLDNITFRDINWREDRGMAGKLFIADPLKVPVIDSSNADEFKIVEQINYLNNRIAFRLIEVLKR